jgi:GGDEF domain-containing protein
MGTALRDAVGEDGTAYRFGGDEFCVLLTCPAARFEAASRRAAQALTASGPGFDVNSSWGAATVPAEEADDSAALRLADIRMYAQKESRRLANETFDPRIEPARGGNLVT